MRRRAGWVVLGVLVAGIMAIVLPGVTDTFGTGGVFTSQIGGSSSDGAGHDTFWDSQVVDIPGAALTAVHCHGSVTYVIQLGATGPNESNACYAAMGMYGGGSSQFEVYLTLPGDQAVYRVSDGYGPWRYCIGSIIHSSGPVDLQPASIPASPC